MARIVSQTLPTKVFRFFALVQVKIVHFLLLAAVPLVHPVDVPRPLPAEGEAEDVRAGVVAAGVKFQALYAHLDLPHEGRLCSTTISSSCLSCSQCPTRQLSR